MERFRHHAGRARHKSCHQLQHRDSCVGKERAQYGQHASDSFSYEMIAPFGLSRKRAMVAMARCQIIFHISFDISHLVICVSYEVSNLLMSYSKNSHDSSTWNK